MFTYKDTLASKKRISFLSIIIAFIFLIISYRLFFLQVIRHNHFLVLANSQHWSKDILEPKRGIIYAKDYYTGELVPLALNQSLGLVYAVPAEIKESKLIAQKLAPTLGLNEDEILEKFKTSRFYVPLKRKLSEEKINEVKNLGLQGIFVTNEYWRLYPENELLAHVLGFVNDEKEGKYGLEEFLNKDLKGEFGLLKTEVDASGVQIAFGDNLLVPPKDGESIVLTINRDIQMQVEEKLKNAVEKHQAVGGNAIVMDPNTGAIIAMANYPGFNPNNFGEEKSYQIFTNPSVEAEFEPGSIFKIVTMAAGLDSGKVQADTTFNDNGAVNIDGYTIKNATGQAFGNVNMTKVLEQSINTGTVFVLSQIGKDTFYDYVKKFGFGSKTNIESPLEVEGKVKAPSEVGNHTYATMTFGQAISVTPIQMVQATAVIANGGKLVQPHLIEKIIPADENKKEKEIAPKILRKVISPQTAATLTAMMINVVEKGHGYQAKVSGYKVAGKTGTAQVPKEGGGYDPGKNIGSFTGFVPALDPKFVIYTKINYPKGVAWAESTAAPLFGEVADILLKYYQIPPTE